MKEVKRYDFMSEWGGGEIVENPLGEFVLVEDYDALVRENEQIRAANLDELQALKAQEAMQADRQYIMGLKAGWNFAQSNDEAGYACAVNGRRAEIHAQKGEAE